VKILAAGLGNVLSASGQAAHLLLSSSGRSKCDLGPYRNGVELRAGVASADRTYLSGDVTMQVVEQETGKRA
jgi:hypothetical protein